MMFSQHVCWVFSCMFAFIAVGVTSPTGQYLLQDNIIGCVTVGCSTPKPTGCIGTIKLKTKDAVHSISAVDAGSVVNKNYGEVDAITVEGNCCWRVATRRNIKGWTRDFMQTVVNNNHQQKIKSVKIIDCEDEWPDSTIVASDSTKRNVIEDVVKITENTEETTGNREATTIGTAVHAEDTTVDTKATPEITNEDTTVIIEDMTVFTALHGEEITINTKLSTHETTIGTIAKEKEATMDTTVGKRQPSSPGEKYLDSILMGNIIGCETVGCSTAGHTCTGTIKLKTKDEVHYISAVDADGVVNKNYGEVDAITVEGNCCWRVATRRNIKGWTRDFIQTVTDSYHKRKVKSLEKIECGES